MPVVNRIADFSADMAAWRQHLHTIPELGLDCFKTSAYVAERLREFGVDELHEGVAQTGIVDASDGDALAGSLATGQVLVSRDGAVWRWTAEAKPTR